MKIKTKLLIVFSTVIIVSSISTFGMIHFLHALDVNAENSTAVQLYEDRIQGLVAYDAILNGSSNTYVETGSKNVLSRYMERSDSFTTIARNAAKLELPEGIGQRIDEIVAYRSKLSTIEAEAFELANQNKSAEGLALLASTEYKGSQLEFAKLTRDESQQNQRLLAGNIVEREKSIDHAIALAWAILIIVCLWSLGSASMVALPISWTLKDLEDVAQAIGRGETGRRVAVRSGDEIGRAAIAFNKLAVVLDNDRMSKKLKDLTKDVGI